MPVDDDSVRLDTRLAGQVKRYHTWPTISTQTIAEHCWQLLRIYLSVVKTPDINIIIHIQTHDIGEHFTGDIPYPVKSLNPELKRQMDFLERKSQAAQLEHWESFHQVLLTEEDKEFFKLIELVEMAEFGIGEMLLGNNHGFIIADRCLKAVYQRSPSVELCDYIIKRLRLFHKQCFADWALDDDWWHPKIWERLHGS